MSQGVYRAAVLYNTTRGEYVLIDPQTMGGNPANVTWSWVSNPKDATAWINVLEMQYYLTDTPLGNPTQVPYPWEIQWLYFAS